MDIEQYNPNNNPKYNRFIYKFLKKEKKRIELCGSPIIVKTEPLGMWRIGWEDDDGWFTGATIKFSELCDVETYAFRPGGKKTEEIQWREYQRIGACAIDDYAHKWREVNRNSRCCEYCGKWVRRKVVTEKIIRRQVVWENES